MEKNYLYKLQWEGYIDFLFLVSYYMQKTK